MSIQATLRQKLRESVKELFQLELTDLTVEVPPRAELGDLAFPVAFELAKRLKTATAQKQNPREIASRLLGEISGVPGVSRVETAGAGYLNVFLDRAVYIVRLMEEQPAPSPTFGGKVIVEHTSINPNKTAHIGHLRNAVLGDTIVRLLKSTGEQVEVQNYIDNTGVQVADVVVGFKYLDQKTLEQVKAIERFDHYCWDLYARVGGFYEEDKSRLKLRERTLHEIESGEGETAELAEYISTTVLRCHLDTMLRIGVRYDVLPRESDVLHLHIWERAFDMLKETGAVEHATEGRLAGCWVMRAVEEQVSTGEKESEHEADKVIVRSNGTVTYTGKDIAFHLWKLGRLGIDFYYKQFYRYPDGNTAWVTTSKADENVESHTKFGNGALYFNVIDIGQSYPQHYVKMGVIAADHDEKAERSAHLAYEKVVLSPAAAEQLGQRISDDDRNRGVISMSGRKGLGVKAGDLIDQLQTNALAEVAARHPDLVEEDRRLTANQIAVGALRYFLLKYTRTSIISFDFKEALSFEGEAGPYIQYSVVRADSILRKLRAGGIDPDKISLDPSSASAIAELLHGRQGDELWSLIYSASRLDDTIRTAITSLEPAVVAKWTFQLAQSFNLFYHHHHILSEPDPIRRDLLVVITLFVRKQLIRALDLLGIQAPERM